MHRVDKPEQVTRAVAVYEYVGDLQHPKAARLTPVSLFIAGHFEDAGIYLARPIPFALDTGLRYDLQRSGVRQDYLDLVASRNFAGSATAGTTPFDDGWVGYGRVVPPAPPKAARARPNCGNAHVVQEAGAKDDGRPRFGSKPASAETGTPAGRDAGSDPCRDDDVDRPEKISLADDARDKNAPDPERPTLHRSPESSAHNTGAQGKPDKKSPKPPAATVTANSSPADDPDRPTIRHRTTDENDPNALPPDPIELAGRERAKALLTSSSAQASDASAPASKQAALTTNVNDTVAEGGNITAGDTTSGSPVLRRGHLTSPAPDAPASTRTPAPKPAAMTAAQNASPPSALSQPLDAIVAVSDVKDRPTHDFTYHFASATERAAALGMLKEMARAVAANPALATDAPEGTVAAQPATAAKPLSVASRAVTRQATARVKLKAPAPSHTAPLTFADEQLSAHQLYFSAPITYTYSARVPASSDTPERFVTVVAQTDADGKLQPAMRTITDAAHLDRIPRYRLIDVVDADGSNRASLLMELRGKQTRQFALYRLLGNKPDQIFITGSTLL